MQFLPSLLRKLLPSLLLSAAAVAAPGIARAAYPEQPIKMIVAYGAGIDVWDTEPPPLDHPLLAMDNVFASFHIAGVTHEARRNVAAIAAEQIVGVLSGERPPRLINPEVWPEFEKRRARILG